MGKIIFPPFSHVMRGTAKAREGGREGVAARREEGGDSNLRKFSRGKMEVF